MEPHHIGHLDGEPYASKGARTVRGGVHYPELYASNPTPD